MDRAANTDTLAVGTDTSDTEAVGKESAGRARRVPAAYLLMAPPWRWMRAARSAANWRTMLRRSSRRSVRHSINCAREAHYKARSRTTLTIKQKSIKQK